MGTGQDGVLSARDKKMIVEAFLKGLPQAEQTALRLVASDTEMSDIDALAKRASRSARTQTSVNAVPIQTSKSLPEKQELTEKKRERFTCWYCHKRGHSWRACYKRAREDRNWVPKTNEQPTENKSA